MEKSKTFLERRCEFAGQKCQQSIIKNRDLRLCCACWSIWWRNYGKNLLCHEYPILQTLAAPVKMTFCQSLCDAQPAYWVMERSRTVINISGNKIDSFMFLLGKVILSCDAHVSIWCYLTIQFSWISVEWNAETSSHLVPKSLLWKFSR